jgi:hypothetical protein
VSARAGETALWPAGTFARAYAANRRAGIESIIDADPVAACVARDHGRAQFVDGKAADLLRAGADRSSNGISRYGTGWPKNPRALAGRLRRAQTFLRMLGIEISFAREGRAGTRTIRISARVENRATIVSGVSSVSTVSAVSSGCHNIWTDLGRPAQGLAPSSRCRRS